VELQDNRVKSKSERQFNIEEEHEVKLTNGSASILLETHSPGWLIIAEDDAEA
jgi:hypothetical protein